MSGLKELQCFTELLAKFLVADPQVSDTCSIIVRDKAVRNQIHIVDTLGAHSRKFCFNIILLSFSPSSKWPLYKMIFLRN
jgi:hypothetical protein